MTTVSLPQWLSVEGQTFKFCSLVWLPRNVLLRDAKILKFAVWSLRIEPLPEAKLFNFNEREKHLI